MGRLREASSACEFEDFGLLLTKFTVCSTVVRLRLSAPAGLIRGRRGGRHSRILVSNARTVGLV